MVLFFKRVICFKRGREKAFIKGMRKAMEHLEELSRDKELLYKALSRENSEMAYRLDKQGWIEEGRKEGEEKAVRSLVLKMLQENADKTFISKLTGLSEDEIIKLKNQDI